MTTPRKLYAVDSHEQVLEILRNNGTRKAKLLHLDFHCDLRGLLINRKTNRAYRIPDRFGQLDEGNFLTHAFVEGVVDSIRWVHDEPGGRKNDLKTVKYETDLSALVHRAALALRRDRGKPIAYQVIANTDWNGIQPGEILDIDWDFFASIEYPVESIQRRIDNFLSRQFDQNPVQTFVCYSPKYSHPTRSKFEAFVDELAQRFQAEVVKLPKPVTSKSDSPIKSTLQPIFVQARHLYHSACLALRRHGIY